MSILSSVTSILALIKNPGNDVSREGRDDYSKDGKGETPSTTVVGRMPRTTTTSRRKTIPTPSHPTTARATPIEPG